MIKTKRKALLRIAAWAVLCTGMAAQAGQARNPIIWADVPDPAVIRVGDTYYMGSTTMHMCPGLPIRKSKDLVNWAPARYAYRKLEDNDETMLQNGRNMYGKGSWASSLRYHNEVHCVTTFALNTGKTCISKVPDIESGKWEGTSFHPLLCDDSLFFDDAWRFSGLKATLPQLRSKLKPTESTPQPLSSKPADIRCLNRVAWSHA